MDEKKYSTKTEMAESNTSTPKRAIIAGPFELLERAWGLYKERARTLIGIVLIPAAVIVFFALFTSQSGEVINGPFFIGHPFLAWSGSLPIILIQMAMIAALLYAIVIDPPIQMGEAYKKGLAIFFPYAWISILVGVITFVGFILFFIPGVIFSIWFSFAFFTLVVENKRGFAALAASREYVRGYWWPIFWRSLFLMLVLLVAIAALGLLSMFLRFVPSIEIVVSNVGGVLLSLLFTPLFVAYIYYLYLEVRAIKMSKQVIS